MGLCACQGCLGSLPRCAEALGPDGGGAVFTWPLSCPASKGGGRHGHSLRSPEPAATSQDLPPGCSRRHLQARKPSAPGTHLCLVTLLRKAASPNPQAAQCSPRSGPSDANIIKKHAAGTCSLSASWSDVPSGSSQPGQGGTPGQADEAEPDGGRGAACKRTWLQRYVNCLGHQVWSRALGPEAGFGVLLALCSVAHTSFPSPD